MSEQFIHLIKSEEIPWDKLNWRSKRVYEWFFDRPETLQRRNILDWIESRGYRELGDCSLILDDFPTWLLENEVPSISVYNDKYGSKSPEIMTLLIKDLKSDIAPVDIVDIEAVEGAKRRGWYVNLISMILLFTISFVCYQLCQEHNTLFVTVVLVVIYIAYVVNSAIQNSVAGELKLIAKKKRRVE